MDLDTATKANVDNLRELLRNASVIQASQYFNGQDVQVIPSPPDHKLGQVLSRYIAMVLLTSNELRIVFKVHFNPEQIRTYRQARGASADDLSDKQLIDFMKELSNQMGGRVCRIFDAHQIAIGMSVPLCTRGIYEIYADYQPKSGAITKFGDFWQLNGPFDTIYCSCFVELMGKDDFSTVKAADEVAEEGELDFL
ncbi:MAG: hypothetical protein EPO09_10680 [Aquabacterium sp.]|uniref:hypothetical protein n=1 Tax=Aquabacterium sp. TaxID=1872578 RepID=UPI0011F89744|nr:hypothetical protein [Aquabacterium sp.]TAK94054.1 MAG: hypothetical protein EPO09_10680 [Aquabacterium sp.]